jgi:hypothetical protein
MLGALNKGGAGGMGNMGSMGGIMSAPPKSTVRSSSGHSHEKRQFGGFGSKGKGKSNGGSSMAGMMDSMMSAVFIGGGGSAGSGSGFAAKNTNVKSGVYISPSNKFMFSAEIVNYDPREKDIYLSLDYEWVPGKVPGLMDVGMGALSANDCNNLNGLFIPPKDRPITYQGADWTVTQNGYFVNFTPHLHDGGVNVKIILNGESSCASISSYSS